MLAHVVLVLLAAPALAAAGYLFTLTALSWPRRRPPRPATPLRFDIVVPAHDEEGGIGRTVENLLSLDWPRGWFRVLVVADNCADRTAAIAAAAGATVLVRAEPERRGKGHALAFAFERVIADGGADAVVVVDADTTATPNLLAACAARLGAGARAIQVRYAVLNGDDSWRTRLMAVAFAAFHDVRSLGRERLGLSCGLRGNGMCFSREVLRSVPHRAFSIVEDLEYGIRLGEAGIRVHYAGEAEVRGEMPSGGRGARTQRRRWERGRLEMVRRHGLGLLGRGLVRRDAVLLDLAADVLVPPLGWLAGYSALGALVAAANADGSLTGRAALAAWLLPCAFLVAHVLRGVRLSGTGLRGLVALPLAALYVVWKLTVVATSAVEARGVWVRTERADPAQQDGIDAKQMGGQL
jgi:hypothetical protein